MYIKSRPLSLAMKLAIVFFGALGLQLSMGLFSGHADWGALNYFTILGNLFALACFSAAVRLAFFPDRGELPADLKGAATLDLTLIMLVAYFFLGGFRDLSLPKLLLHYAVPVLAILDWLLFDKKGRYDAYSPAVWLSFPVLYIIYVFFRAAFSEGPAFGRSRFPYPFLNVERLGAGTVSKTLVVIFLGILLLGYLAVLLDKRLSRPGRAPGEPGQGPEG